MNPLSNINHVENDFLMGFSILSEKINSLHGHVHDWVLIQPHMFKWFARAQNFPIHIIQRARCTQHLWVLRVDPVYLQNLKRKKLFSNWHLPLIE